MKVCYLFRNSRAGFSIAKVFNSFLPYIKEKAVIELPCYRADIYSLLKNIVYLLRHRCNCDIYHLTGNVEYCALALPRRKTILTVHDLVLINHNDTGKIKRLVFYYLWFYFPFKRVRLITCISEKTKSEIISYFPWVESKLIVVPNPVSEDIHYVKKEFNKEKPVVLHVGTRENKNLEKVAKALRDIPAFLRIIGEVSESQKKILKENGINYISEANLTDKEIAEEYTRCDIVSFPSTYEGFGMPIIEGFASGRIIVTSSLEPMRTISNGNTILVNPYDVESIRRGFIEAIEDESGREEKIIRGLKEAERYYAEKIANEYNDVYNKLLKNE